MISLKELADFFRRNIQIIKLQAEDLSQEDSLIQLPFRANCFNWIVGHVLTNRCNILELMGTHDIRDEVNLDHYEREAEPIHCPGEGVLDLSELITHLETTQSLLEEALEKETDQSIQRAASFRGASERPLAYWIFFLYFHDSYHVGQTEILRQAAGKNDKII
jgi:hypothetical protein